MDSSRPSASCGQASAELVAVLPVLAVGLLVAAQLALIGWSVWSAGNAARAGARAAYVGGGAEAAARSALPGPLRDGSRVEDGEGVEVSVRAPSLVPGLPPLEVDAAADLGTGDG